MVEYKMLGTVTLPVIFTFISTDYNNYKSVKVETGVGEKEFEVVGRFFDEDITDVNIISANDSRIYQVIDSKKVFSNEFSQFVDSIQETPAILDWFEETLQKRVDELAAQQTSIIVSDGPVFKIKREIIEIPQID